MRIVIKQGKIFKVKPLLITILQNLDMRMFRNSIVTQGKHLFKFRLAGRCGSLPVFKEKRKMRIGSLVELVNDNWNHKGLGIDINTKYPIKGKIYTVREIVFGDAIRLSEIVNKKQKYKHAYGEKAFTASRFRELQPPMHISIESILECELV